jgi:hypothetical protein
MGKIVKKFHHVPFSHKFQFSILAPSGSLQDAKNHLNGVKTKKKNSAFLSLLTCFGGTTMWVNFIAVDGPVFSLREVGKGGFFRLSHLEASITRPTSQFFLCVKKLTRAPLMASRDCVNSPDSFCYICGEVYWKNSRETFLTLWKVCILLARFSTKSSTAISHGPCAEI